MTVSWRGPQVGDYLTDGIGLYRIAGKCPAASLVFASDTKKRFDPAALPVPGARPSTPKVESSSNG